MQKATGKTIVKIQSLDISEDETKKKINESSKSRKESVSKESSI